MILRTSSWALLVAVLLFASTAGAAEHVVHISVDGLHAGHLQRQIEAGQLPHFARLQREGAWTVNARTDHTWTVTLPNHTSMLTGRPVDRPDGMRADVHHGYTQNGTPPRGTTLHGAGNRAVDYVASTFDVVHDAGGTTALFASKEKFVLFTRSYDEHHGAPGDHGRAKIDVSFLQSDGRPKPSATMQRRLLDDLRTRHPRYVFVHYAEPDAAGHAENWGSRTWQRSVEAVDGYLGEILDLVDHDPEFRDRTVLVLTADHGGAGKNHGDADDPDVFTIPVMVWGAGVASGDLYAMNPDTRHDPGTKRVGYDAARQPIRNVDTGNLALHLLGLGPIPGSLVNAAQDLRVDAAAVRRAD